MRYLHCKIWLAVILTLMFAGWLFASGLEPKPPVLTGDIKYRLRTLQAKAIILQTQLNEVNKEFAATAKAACGDGFEVDAGQSIDSDFTCKAIVKEGVK